MIDRLFDSGVGFARESAPPGGGGFLTVRLAAAPCAIATYATRAMRPPSASVTRRILMRPAY
jgi:hypothetical protein